MSLGVNEFLVLFHLWMEEEGSMAMGEVGHLVNVTSGGLTALVDRLERNGFVERSSDSTDRRRTLLQLTGQGEDARASFLALLDAAQRGSAELPVDHREAIDAFISQLTAALTSLHTTGAAEEQ
jgi:DNA-binding MarR family transcriptional regulator